MSEKGFVKLMRGDDALDLLDNHPNAFLLLTKIATIIKRSDSRSTGLKAGSAKITHTVLKYLSRSQFRTELHRLEACKFLTTKISNDGTIVTLCDSSIYDVNLNNESPAESPANRQPMTSQSPAYSIKKERMKENNKKHKANAREIGAIAPEEKSEELVDAIAGQPNRPEQPEQAKPQPESPASASQPEQASHPSKPWTLAHPELFEMFYAMYPNKYGKEVAMAEWNRLGLTADGYKDVICKLKGHIDSGYYFASRGPNDRVQPAIYLRERKYDDIGSDTEAYRKTFEYVVRWCEERGLLNTI